MREISLVFLAGGLLSFESSLIPKCFLKTPDNKTIMEKILNIFSSIDYSGYNLKLVDVLILYPKNYLEKFEKIVKKEELVLKNRIRLEEAGESLTLTISKTIESYTKNMKEDTFLVFVATDTPLITLESIEDIVKRFSLLEGDLFFPFVSKEVYRVQFGKKLAKNRTFFKLSRDSFCSTGIFIIKNSTLNKLWQRFKTIIEKRKNPIEMIKLLGFDFPTVTRLILGNMTVLELEEKINKMLGIKAHGLLTNFANLAFNIDNEKDLENYNELVSSKFVKI